MSINWTEEADKEINNLIDKCSKQAEIYSNKANRYKKLSVILSTTTSICGALVASLTSYSTESKLILGIIVGLGVIITGTPLAQEGAKLQKKAESFFQASTLYGTLSRELKQELLLPPEERMDSPIELIRRAGEFIDRIETQIFQGKIDDSENKKDLEKLFRTCNACNFIYCEGDSPSENSPL